MRSKRMTLLRSAQTASGQCDSNSCICCLIFTRNCPQFRSLHAPPFVAVCQGKSHPGPAHHHLKRFSASALKERESEGGSEGRRGLGENLTLCDPVPAVPAKSCYSSAQVLGSKTICIANEIQ
jgi:hypothetical protein